jgi:phage terminase small subunit
MKLQGGDREHEAASKLFGLSHKEREFAIEYIKNGGKTEAAALAAGYSPSTAKSKCYQIINKPEVKAFMRQLLEAAWDEERMEVKEILARLARIARIDPRSFFNEDGTVKNPSELTEAQAYALRGFQHTTEQFGSGEESKFKEFKSIKMADPLPALRTLAQISQLLAPDQTQINIFMDLDARMDQAKRRLQKREDKPQIEDVQDVKAIDNKVVSEQ